MSSAKAEFEGEKWSLGKDEIHLSLLALTGRQTPNPEEDTGFVSMLANLMLDKNKEADTDSASMCNGAVDAQASAKLRWEAYLQSRLRASRNIMRKSRPNSMLSTASAPVSSSPSFLSRSGRAQSLNMSQEDRRALERAVSDHPMFGDIGLGSEPAVHTR